MLGRRGLRCTLSEATILRGQLSLQLIMLLIPLTPRPPWAQSNYSSRFHLLPLHTSNEHLGDRLTRYSCEGPQVLQSKAVFYETHGPLERKTRTVPKDVRILKELGALLQGDGASENRSVTIMKRLDCFLLQTERFLPCGSYSSIALETGLDESCLTVRLRLKVRKNRGRVSAAPSECLLFCQVNPLLPLIYLRSHR